MNQNLSRVTLMLVGCGTMGSALLKAWLHHQNIFKKVIVVTPHRERVPPFKDEGRLQWVSDSNEVDTQPDIILFAVKPQILPEILPLYRRFNETYPLFLTIVAGFERAFYEVQLPYLNLIRIMPNLPVVIFKGMSALCANARVTQAHKHQAEYLMQQVGQIIWVEDDQAIDRVTAVSGCGPAYVYLLAEALQKGAESLGLGTEQATLLSRQTIIGSSSYLEQSPQLPFELRQQVTSPGGMTEAAVAFLQQNGQFDKMILEALGAAMHRAANLRGT